MSQDTYFDWLLKSTRTSWWHDSGDPKELARGLSMGASGVTTNPYLCGSTLSNSPVHWQRAVSEVPTELAKAVRAEALMRVVVSEAADQLLATYEATKGREGYVCAQVNPALAGDRERMLEQARRHHSWAPNIAVKLPATSAGLDVLEECTAEGITTAITVSFTVPQVVAAAERFRLGRERARLAGVHDCRCFAVIMIGRLDDYLREVARDQQVRVSEEDIRSAGLAVVKRAHAIYQERAYDAVLLVAALRGIYHMTELAGGTIIMSVAPQIQNELLAAGVPREARIDRPINDDVVDRLSAITEFVRAYEPNGMSPDEFITYGVVQRTLSQFTETGWKVLEAIPSR